MNIGQNHSCKLALPEINQLLYGITENAESPTTKSKKQRKRKGKKKVKYPAWPLRIRCLLW